MNNDILNSFIKNYFNLGRTMYLHDPHHQTHYQPT